MKNTIMVWAMALLISGSMSAQKISSKDVPGKVISAFQSKYPLATDIRWQRESATEYEAEFKTDNQRQSVKYNQDAQWLETEMGITESSLPIAILDKLHTIYSAYKVRETEKVDTSDRGTIYEIEMANGKAFIMVRFSPAGVVLSTE